MDTSARTERIYLYMKRAKELIKARNTDGDEFAELLIAIKVESTYLSPERRNQVLKDFFDMWDRRN